MSDLKPCPFCGSDDVYVPMTDSRIDWYFVWCPGCCFAGPGRTKGQDAIEAWNRRAKDE